MKPVKNSLISIGIVLFFLIALNIGNNVTSAYASPTTTQPTVTEVFADRLEAHTFDSIYFTIHVSSNGNPVPSGQVRVYEATTSYETKTGDIIDGVAIVEYIVMPGIPSGWRTFVAEYVGTADYYPSAGTTEVSLSDPQGTGVWETQTTITPSLTQAGANENITFAVDITILGGAFPFFSGGYVALIDLSENIILDRHDIEMSPVLTYSVDFDFTVPNWYSTGVHVIEAQYSGSYDADHAPSSDSCQIQLIIDGNIIEFTSNATEVNREDEVIQLDASILGDNPTGQFITLQASQNDGSIQMILEETTLDSSEYSYTFTPSYTNLLGPILFEIFLEDSTSGDILAEANLTVIIYDTVEFIHEFDQTSYTDGDTVLLTVYAVEADLPTQPVMGDITVNDVTLGIELTQSTNGFGRADFSWMIPINSSGGVHEVLISIVPSGIYHQGTITSTFINIHGDIQFVVGHPTNVQRGNQVSLTCTILSNSGTTVTEGTLNLKDSGNNIIWSTTLSGTAQYNYNFGLSAPIGPTGFVWEYSGTDNYEAGTFSFSIIVLSAPHFNALTLNKSSVVEGEVVQVVGQLVDEIGQGVSGVDVTIWDSGILIGTVSTQTDGSFVYNYLIPSGASLGIHIIESHFDGNYAVYRLASNNVASAVLTVNAPIQLNIVDTLISGEIAELQISGGPGEEITLSWSPHNNQSLWYSIGSVLLDGNGDGTWDWLVPAYKGDISVRAKNDANYMDIIDTSVFTRSEITVNNLPSEVLVDEQFNVQINVSEQYRILLNGNIMEDWREAGLHELNISLSTRGIHVLEIQTQGDFVIQESFTYNIVSFEPLVVTMEVPDSISTTATINANIHVEGIYSGNVNGIVVKLFVNSNELATGTTTSSGNVILSFSLSPGTYTITCRTDGQTNYYQDSESSASIVVRSGTTLVLPSASVYYYDVYTLSTTLNDDGINPVSGQQIEFSISNDLGSSWTIIGQTTTSEAGIAQYEWFVSLNPGNYLIRVSFAGSYYYDASSTTSGINILPNDIQITWDNLIGTYGTSIPLNGSITTISGNSLNTSLHLAISVYYDDQWVLVDEVDTTTDGILGLLINLTLNPGTYPIQISFSGNEYFNSHISVKDLTITQIETQIIVDQSNYETTYGTIEVIPVSITTSSGNPIQSGNLTCLVVDESQVLLTFTEPIIAGQSTFTIPIEQLGIGNYNLNISWPGTVIEAEASLIVDMTVNKGTAQLDVTINDPIIDYGDTTIWSAYVTNALGNPISGIPVNFASSKTGYYWDNWGTFLTNESGYATIEIVWTEENQNYYGSPGTYTIKISLEDNNMVNIEQTTRMITVEKMDVILSLNDLSVFRLETTQISGTISTLAGDPVTDAILTISWNANENGDWQNLGIVSTDNNGMFTLDCEVLAYPQTYNLRVEFDGDTYHNAASQNAVLEVLDNTSILQNIQLSEPIINLGDSFLISVNTSDLDGISLVYITIYNDNDSFDITLDYMNGSYQTEIVCDISYNIGIWNIDVTIIDQLGISTIYYEASLLEIADNPGPIVTYSLSSNLIVDGESIQFEITASDTLGIASVNIEIEGQIYAITTVVEDVFYFDYTPQTTGILPFTLTVEDYGGQQTVVTANFEVQAVAPELTVVSMAPLNGTAPYPFFLNIEAIDNSGVDSVVLYANSVEYILQYNQETGYWEISGIFTADSYLLTIIATDNVGVENIVELGVLTVSDPSLTVSSTQFELGDTVMLEITGLNPEVVANAKVIISSPEYSQEYAINNISSTINIDIYLDENYPLAAYSVTLEIEDFNENKTICDNGIEFIIYTNSNPSLNVVFENQILADGETTNFTIEATDSLGIESIVIIRGDQSINLTLDENNVVTGEIQFDEAGTYMVQVVATDNAGAQTSRTFTFTVNAEGPEFVSVYPSQTMLAGLHTPFTLDIEALVTDASGVTSVTLYINDTEYALVNTFGVWYTTVELNDSTYSMSLVAVDIYGSESVYDLGTVTPQEEKLPDTSDDSGPTGSNEPEIPDVEPKIDTTIIIMGFTLLTIIGSSVLSWRRKD